MGKPVSDRQLLVLGDNVFVFSSDIHRVWKLPKKQLPSWLPSYLALRERGVSDASIRTKIRKTYGVSEAAYGAVMKALRKSEITTAEMKREQRRVEGREQWRKRGWEDAWRYHASMFNVEFLDYAAGGARQDIERMHLFLDREKMPPVYKEAPAKAKRVRVSDLLNGKETKAPQSASRAPSNESVDKERFDALLNLTFGEIRSLKVDAKRLRHEPLLKKTSPSGGARHPTEAYVFVFDVKGVAPGVYHYQVRTNELALIKAGNLWKTFQALAIRDHEQPHFVPKLGVVLTSIPERSMFRYRESRSYRVLHYDAGHLLRTFDMAASAYGLQTYANYGVDEPGLEKLLGLSAFEELPLAAAVVGWK